MSTKKTGFHLRAELTNQVDGERIHVDLILMPPFAARYAYTQPTHALER